MYFIISSNDYSYQQEGKLSVEEAMEQAKNLGIMTAAGEPANDENGEEKIFNFGVYKYGRDRTSLSRRILQVCQVCDVFSDQWNPASSKS